AMAAYDARVATASHEERDEATTHDSISTTNHAREIQRYTTGIEAIRQHLVRDIPARIIGRRRFDSMSSAGQVGELRRQLERQRGGLGVRDLMDRYGDLILNLTPCVLMSPESVARFLQPD